MAKGLAYLSVGQCHGYLYLSLAELRALPKCLSDEGSRRGVGRELVSQTELRKNPNFGTLPLGCANSQAPFLLGVAALSLTAGGHRV